MELLDFLNLMELLAILGPVPSNFSVLFLHKKYSDIKKIVNNNKYIITIIA